MKKLFLILMAGAVAAVMPHPADYFFIAGAVGFYVFRKTS